MYSEAIMRARGPLLALLGIALAAWALLATRPAPLPVVGPAARTAAAAPVLREIGDLDRAAARLRLSPAVLQPRGRAVEVADLAQDRCGSGSPRRRPDDRKRCRPGCQERPRRQGDAEKREERTARAHGDFRVHQSPAPVIAPPPTAGPREAPPRA